MTIKITRDVLESDLNCKYKGHLKHIGQQGTNSDYATLLIETRAEVRLAALDKILSRHAGDEIPRNIPLTASALKQGAPFLLDAILEDDLFSLAFDGLKRVEGPSKLGDFHYVPILLHEQRKIGRTQRLLVEVHGFLLSSIRGRTPGHGVIWHGEEYRATTVRLRPDLPTIERLVRELKDVATSELPPHWILNGHCPACEFRQRCHAQAVQEDNLSLLRGRGIKEIKSYARKGILTVSQLAHTFRPRRKPKRAAQSSKKRYHALQALSIRDRCIYVFGTPQILTSPVTIYLDVESTSERGFVYLIGMIVVENGSEKRYSLWADDPDQEPLIFEQFLAVVAQYEDFVVFCYGNYEKAFLKRMRRLAKRKKSVHRVLNRLRNVLSLIYSHVYFPAYSNGLKDIGGCLGCSWTELDASGIQSMAWRMRWEATHAEEWKQKLLTYNLEDCMALKKVTDLLCVIGANSALGERPLTVGDQAVPVSLVQEVDKLANNRKWGRISFYHPDYEYINDCAYFAYQRDRVYIRTSRRLRQSKARRLGSRNRLLRVTRRLQIATSQYPYCKSKDITAVVAGDVRCRKPRVKRAFDLVFTSGGIKRKVVECRTSVHRCFTCAQDFVPERHLRLDKHFHGLKSWAMYQHGAHRLSLGTIQSMFEDLFGLRIFDSEIHMVKSLMARH